MPARWVMSGSLLLPLLRLLGVAAGREPTRYSWHLTLPRMQIAVPLGALLQGPKVLTGLDSSATLDGYNTGLSAVEEVPFSVEARLSPELAQQAEFVPAELDAIDGGWGS